MSAVVWRRLTLQGFGRFRDGVTLELDAGLNTWSAANESGKSTLVAGLTAVLFGLPAYQDPSQVGKGRYRNWHGASRFEGEMIFEAGGATYRIQRNFEKDEVRLARLEDGAWVEELAGPHGPSLRKSVAGYEERLQGLLGVSTREVFEQTFCVTQPLPETKQVDREVQKLLSGAGGSGFQEALGHLEQQVRDLTRFVKQYGLSDRDGQKDRPLEELARRREELQAKIAASREAVDGLTVIKEKLGAATQERDAARDQLARRQATKNAWVDWRRHVERWRAATREQAALQAAAEEAAALSRQAAERRGALLAAYPEMREAPPEAGDTLDRLLHLEERLEQIRREREPVERDYAARRQEQSALEDDLNGRLAPVRGRESIAREHEALLARLRDLQAVQAQLTRSVAEESSYRDEVRRLPDWGELGRAPAQMVGTLRLIAADAVRGWRQFEENRRELEEAEQPEPPPDAAAERRRRILWAVAGFLLAAVFPGLLLDRLGLVGIFASLAISTAAAAYAWFLAGQVQRPPDPVLATRQAEKRARRTVLKTHAESWAQSEFGSYSPRIESFPTAELTGKWRQLTILARLAGEPPHTVGDLVHWMEHVAEGRWEELQQQAARWEELRDILQRSRTPHLKERQEALASEVARLREAISPFSEQTPPDELAALVQEYRQKAEQLTRVEAFLAEAGRRLGELRQGEAAAHGEAEAARRSLAPLLQGRAPREARERWRAWRAGQVELEKLEVRLETALQGGRLEDLQAKVAAAQSQAMLALAEAQRLADRSPGLPDLDAPAAAVEERLQALDADILRLTGAAEAAESERQALLDAQASLLRDPVNIAAAELELRQVERELERLTLHVRALAEAHRELRAAADDYQRSHRERLAAQAGAHFARLTATPDRRVRLSEEFALAVLEPDGQVAAVEQLSQGAQDQLFLAVRLAIADLIAGDAALPFVFDDPFVSFDAARLANMRHTLTALAVERQVLLLSHRDDLAEWGVQRAPAFHPR